jgi:hypothetical protein
MASRQPYENVVPLRRLLREASASFRAAVLEALAREGFELDDPVPNLQLPSQLLDAVDWLESRGHGIHWKRFEGLLLNADREGALVDLGSGGEPC